MCIRDSTCTYARRAQRAAHGTQHAACNTHTHTAIRSTCNPGWCYLVSFWEPKKEPRSKLRASARTPRICAMGRVLASRAPRAKDCADCGLADC
eukprot:15479832-Alexandrium_andersonii.AAC.1